MFYRLFRGIKTNLIGKGLGEGMLTETKRTLTKAHGLEKKEKKLIAKFLLKKITEYIGEIEGLPARSREMDEIIKRQGNEATTMRQLAISPLEDNDPNWLQAAILENFNFALYGSLGKERSKYALTFIFEWIEDSAPDDYKKYKKKLDYVWLVHK